MRTREEILDIMGAHINWGGKRRHIAAFPHWLPEDIRHGQKVERNGKIGVFLLSEQCLLDEELEIAQDIWDNGF